VDDLLIAANFTGEPVRLDGPIGSVLLSTAGATTGGVLDRGTLAPWTGVIARPEPADAG
jgi:Domain of unknown function (DUF3459)